MDDALAVISASTDNIDILHKILAPLGDEPHPEQWLDTFQAQRKGSRSSGQKTASWDQNKS